MILCPVKLSIKKYTYIYIRNFKGRICYMLLLQAFRGDVGIDFFFKKN